MVHYLHESHLKLFPHLRIPVTFSLVFQLEEVCSLLQPYFPAKNFNLMQIVIPTNFIKIIIDFSIYFDPSRQKTLRISSCHYTFIDFDLLSVI